MVKLLHNCTHLTSRQSNAQILQARLQQYVNRELPLVQAGFRKGRETKDQIATICWIIKKATEFQKNICFCFILTMPKPLTVQITVNCGKFSKRDGNTRPSDLSLEKPVCRSESNSQNQTWNNRLVQNRKRSTSRLYIVNLLI